MTITRPLPGRRIISMLLVVASVLALALVGPTDDAAATALDNNCKNGSFAGRGYNELSNGTLVGKFCKHTNKNAAQAEVLYVKSGGAPVNIRLGWEFTDAKGSRSSGRTLGTKRRITAGEDSTYRADYAFPGRASSDPNALCYRGVMVQYTDAGAVLSTYSTRVVCP